MTLEISCRIRRYEYLWQSGGAAHYEANPVRLLDAGLIRTDMS